MVLCLLSLHDSFITESYEDKSKVGSGIGKGLLRLNISHVVVMRDNFKLFVLVAHD